MTTRSASSAGPAASRPSDAAEAVAFLAEGPLGSRQVIPCGYLNRGLLTIDVHTVDPQIPNVMYRAHFYRSEGAVLL
ncbi:hypothetical protein ACNPQM_16370 [Streptomyces sp. NPDC056231]|uniref:hypothetical protein n=1 Tax=Streptomyces sp. NPDC056231 TaxID=3345755 RepID=UPI003AAA8F98